jgi:hypothetical protein
LARSTVLTTEDTYPIFFAGCVPALRCGCDSMRSIVSKWSHYKCPNRMTSTNRSGEPPRSAQRQILRLDKLSTRWNEVICRGQRSAKSGCPRNVASNIGWKSPPPKRQRRPRGPALLFRHQHRSATTGSAQGYVMLLDNRSSLGQGARRRCLVCGFPIKIKTTGRPAKFCSPICRDTARRKANFEISGRARYPHCGEPRNPQKTPTNSTLKIDLLADRGCHLNGPIVTVGLGCHAAPQPPERSNERAMLIRTALRLEFAARWGRGIRRAP